MRLQPRKKFLGIIIASTLTIFPFLSFAGTGPASNVWTEDAYMESEAPGATSTRMNFYFPASSTAPDQEYFDHYPQMAYGVSLITSTVFQQDASGCWPYAPSLTGGSGGLVGSTTLVVPATSGTLLFHFFPTETTAPTLNIADTSTPAKMIAFSASSTRCSDWTTGYWDFDTLQIGASSTTSSTRAEISWVWPLQDSSATISNPYQYKFDISGLDLNSSTEYQVEIVLSKSPDPWNFLGSTSSELTTFYERSAWFNAQSVSYDDFIVTSTHNLYQLGQISMYSAIANLRKRTSGMNNYVLTSHANLFFVSSNESASSTEQINSYLSGPASSTINTLYSDCTWNDIACGLKNFAVWFFIPWDNSLQAIADVFEGYKSIFPFNVLFLATEYHGNQGWFMGDVLSQSQNTSDDLYLSLNIAGQTSSIKIAGRTYLKDTFGIELTNLFFNIVLVFFTLTWITFVYQTIKNTRL